MTHETNYFIKEEAPDDRKATKLVMSLQSNEIKLAGPILLKVLTFKKVNFDDKIDSFPKTFLNVFRIKIDKLDV